MRMAVVMMLFANAACAAAQSPSRIAGCYDFPNADGGYFGWMTWDPVSRVSVHRNSIVQLDAARLRRFGRLRTLRRLRVPALQDSTAEKRHALSNWRPLGRDSLALDWSDGHGGLRVRVAVRGDSLVGIASHFGDVLGGPPPRWFPIHGVRVTCPDSARR